MSKRFDFDFKHVYGGQCASAVLRHQPEDFQVGEMLDIPLSGAGEHHWLHIQKRNTNTEWLARQLAKLAGVPARDVSYAGLKDRIALTTQWFSIRLPGKSEPDWQQIETDDVKLLSSGRHISKLRRGAHRGNRFVLVLRDVVGEREVINQRLSKVLAKGVPNYFGEQRFGHGGKNVENGVLLLNGEIKVKDRHKRSLYYSSVRSYFFNKILSARVETGSWCQLLLGEAVILSGTNSHFLAETVDESLSKRLLEGDVHPSAPLWGRGRTASSLNALDYEQSILAEYQDVLNAMEHAGLEQARRSLRLLVPDLQWRWQDDDYLQLSFSLPVGSYATALLREVFEY